MASLLKAIDRASGYVFAGARAMDESGRTMTGEQSVWAQAMSEQWVGKMDVRDVQERWVDRREEWDALERREWEEEARLAGALPERPAAVVVRDPEHEAQIQIAEAQMRDAPHDVEQEDELLAEQRHWEERRRKEGGVDGIKIVKQGRRQ